MPKFNSGNTDVAPFQALFIANELVSTAITLSEWLDFPVSPVRHGLRSMVGYGRRSGSSPRYSSTPGP